jgi:tRNA(fMet)-specific endonuclease VapC
MLRYMIDTNICIYAMKKDPRLLVNKFSEYRSEICVSSIVVGELLYGIEKSQHRHVNMTRAEHFISLLDVLDFDADAAGHFASIRATLEKQGTPIGSYDLMTAGHARSLGLILVTHNTKEFSRVDGLRLEDWIC